MKLYFVLHNSLKDCTYCNHVMGYEALQVSVQWAVCSQQKTTTVMVLIGFIFFMPGIAKGKIKINTKSKAAIVKKSK